MTCCIRCQGLLVPEIEEYPLPPTSKCINCGHRPITIAPLPLKVYNRGTTGFRTTQCPRGHPYTEANTYFYKCPGDGRLQRKCRTCARMSTKQRQKARKDAVR